MDMLTDNVLSVTVQEPLHSQNSHVYARSCGLEADQDKSCSALQSAAIESGLQRSYRPTMQSSSLTKDSSPLKGQSHFTLQEKCRTSKHPSNQVHAKRNVYKLREGFIIPWGRGERSRSRSIKRTVWKVLQEERSNVAITWGSGVSVPQRSHRCWTGPVRALPAERSGSHNGGPQPFSHRSNSSPEQEGKQRGRKKEGKKCHISVYLASVSRTANVALTPHWVLWLAQQGNS